MSRAVSSAPNGRLAEAWHTQVKAWGRVVACWALTGCASLHHVPTAPPASSSSPDPASAPAFTSANTPDQPTATNVPTPLPAAAAASMTLQGQISLKLASFGDQSAQGVSLGFFFTGNDQAGKLELMTVMGSQVAQMGWQEQQAWLDQGKGRRIYSSLDELSAQALGEPLPLKALTHWMQGQPAPFLPSQEGPSPGQFEQAGWTIDTRDQAKHRLQIQRPSTAAQRGVTIKIHLDI